MKDRGKFTGEVNEPHRADSKPGANSLVVAITVAMLLGVACGLCLSAWLASAASEASALPAASRPDVNEDEPESDVTEPAPDNSEVASAVVNNPTPPNAAGESVDEKEAVSTPPRAPAEKDEKGRDAASKAPRPAASEAETPVETASRKNAPSRGAASPCPLYASASALTVRSGGAASLVLGSPGQQGRVSVTTPDWADIAVFSEGQAGGNRGWMRYSVRSVSKKAGVFSVRVNGPCGSLTVPVKVVRP